MAKLWQRLIFALFIHVIIVENIIRTLREHLPYAKTAYLFRLYFKNSLKTFRKVVTSENDLTITLNSCNISNKTNKEYKMADENTNAHLENINNNLTRIAKSLEVFEVIAISDSRYTSKNKKDIDLNVSKIMEVIKQIKDKL